MKRFINFGSIKQFRDIIRVITLTTQYVGQNESDEPIYDSTLKNPTIQVTASEKIHGSSAGVCYSNPDGFWVQSRKNIITPEKDNAGCAFFAYSKIDIWKNIIIKLSKYHNIDLDKNIISVYFEWAGGSIQRKSACSGLDKRAIIFQHFKVSPIESEAEESAKWYETKINENTQVDSIENNIYNIMNFKVWKFNIDFENAKLSQNKMIDIVENEIEKESFVGKMMGVNGNVGEGMVVTFFYKDCLHRFKVKGEKHSNSRVKTLKVVDTEKEKKKIEFANYACKSFRLEQAWQEIFGIENEKQEPSIRFMGDFLRFVFNDIIKEESDILVEMGLEPKEVGGFISKVAKTWFMEQLSI